MAAARVCYLWGWSVVAASLGPLLLEGLAPDPGGDNVAVRVHGHHPGEVAFLSPAAETVGPGGFATADDLTTWWEGRLLAGHFDGLHAAVARRWRLGRRGLRGDLATDVSGVARVVGDLTGDVAGAARAARDLLERRGSGLRGLGVVTVAGDGERQAVVYERATCCLIVKAVPGAYCSNCPLLGPAEREQALRERGGPDLSVRRSAQPVHCLMPSVSSAAWRSAAAIA